MSNVQRKAWDSSCSPSGSALSLRTSDLVHANTTDTPAADTQHTARGPALLNMLPGDQYIIGTDSTLLTTAAFSVANALRNKGRCD